ncbi:FG-GAP repeat protein [Streptomyces sp. NPDC005301]|uniref:FG-GAP repeat domain-containing protein n=1 Tax=Streptomyces sp. NPDC005301 TaxID=3156874 RepID=UPI0033AD66CF
MRPRPRLLALSCTVVLLAAGGYGCTGDGGEAPRHHADGKTPTACVTRGHCADDGGEVRRDGADDEVPRECVTPPTATGAQLNFRAPVTGEVPRPGDIDGDGVTDLFVDGWYRPVGGGGWRRNPAYLPGSKGGRLTSSRGVSLRARGDALTQELPGNPRTGSGGVLPAADLTGDGRADVVIHGLEKGQREQRVVQYLARGGGDGIESVTELSRTLPEFDAAGVTDVQGDGTADALAFRPPSSPWDLSREHRCDTFFVLRGPFGADGNPARVTAVDLSLGGTVTTRQVVWGDFTGDGRTDLLAESVVGDPDPADEADEPATSDHVELYVGTAEGFAHAGSPPGIAPWGGLLDVRPVSLGDFDGDGADDVLQGTTVRFGGAGFLDATGRTAKAPALRAAAVGDVNGDGRDDLVEAAYRRRHPAGRVTVHLGSDRGPSARAQSSFDRHVLDLPGSPSHEADSDFFGWDVAPADLDADGRDELVVGYVGYNRPREENGYWVFPGTSEGSSANGAYFLPTGRLGTG